MPWIKNDGNEIYTACIDDSPAGGNDQQQNRTAKGERNKAVINNQMQKEENK